MINPWCDYLQRAKLELSIVHIDPTLLNVLRPPPHTLSQIPLLTTKQFLIGHLKCYGESTTSHRPPYRWRTIVISWKNVTHVKRPIRESYAGHFDVTRRQWHHNYYGQFCVFIKINDCTLPLVSFHRETIIILMWEGILQWVGSVDIIRSTSAIKLLQFWVDLRKLRAHFLRGIARL